MSMPKTAVNEHCFLPTGEDDVWGARQILAMQSETVAELVQQTTHSDLGTSVPSAYGLHYLPSLRGRSRVCQELAELS